MRRWIAAVTLPDPLGCGSAGVGTPTAGPALAPSPGTPIARGDAAVAFDPATGKTVLFGGLGASGALGDTWVWDGRRWLQQHPGVSPHSRIGASMTDDPALRGLVLAGGDADAPVGARERADMAATWLWSGSAWVRRDTAAAGSGSGPVAAAAFPEVDGVAGAAEVVRPDDESVRTWTGGGWRAVPSEGERPLSRTGAQVAVDRDGHVGLFGGYVDSRLGSGLRFDTWACDGAGWTNATGPAPPAPTPSPSAFTPPAD